MEILEKHSHEFNVRDLVLEISSKLSISLGANFAQEKSNEFIGERLTNIAVGVAGWADWLFPSIGEGATDIINNLIQGILNPISNRLLFPNIKVKRVHYQSVDSTGKNPATLSGLLIIPDTEHGKPNMPIMGFQHGTIINRDGAPSQFNLLDPLHTPEAVIGMILAALNGYIVVMADYQGLGDDTAHIQPYVSAEPLAQSVIDLLLETKEFMEKQTLNRFNGEVYLTGYSQGGYVTMATAKAISDNPALMDQLPVKAAAPCAGPYSLSEAMRFLMLREEKFVEGGHFILMAIRGFNATYGDEFGDGIFTKEGSLLPEYFGLWDLANGDHTAKEVHAKMPAIPRHCLSPRLLEALSNPESEAFKALAQNDLINFKPQMPMQIYHSPADDMVPYQNAEIAYKHISELKPSVALSPCFYVPMGTIVHVEAALPCLFTAYAWLNTYRSLEKQDLAPGEFIHGGQNMFSADKKYCIRYQLDGELAFYDMSDISLQWKAPVRTTENNTGKCIMQPEDGNLVIYDAKNQPTWASNTNGHPGASFVIGQKGQLTINDRRGRALVEFV